jgi:hypothetical protein
MSIPESYILNTGNLIKCLSAIQSAGIPGRVTSEFLKSLGFKSTNDRPIIAVLKGIGFLDPNGTPTQLYKAFRDKNKSANILGRALKAAYSEFL